MNTWEAWLTRAFRFLLLGSLALMLACSPKPRPTLEPGVDVRGVIRDRDGLGVEGMGVFFDPADDKYTNGLLVRTDRKGAFYHRALPGPYRICLFRFGNYLRVPDVDLDTVWLRAPSARLDYRYGGVKVEGRVFGPGGSPVRSGSIKAWGHGRDQREVALESKIVGGHYKMFVSQGEYYFGTEAPATLPSVDGGQKVDISTDTTIDFSADGHLVTGRVVLGAGQPVPGAHVRVDGMANGQQISAHDEARPDGRYRVYLPSGGYQFLVTPGASDSFVVMQFFSLDSLSAARTLDLDMSGTEWHGTVRDTTTGLPLRSVRIVATSAASTNISAVSVSDERGRFRLVLWPGQIYTVAMTSSKLRIAQKTISGTRANKDSTFDLFVRVLK